MTLDTQANATRRQGSEPGQAAAPERQLEYWTRQLADCVPADFLADRPRPTGTLSGEIAVAAFTIDEPLHEAVRDFSQARNVTAFSVLLAAFRAAHYRFTGAEDAVFGTPKARPAEAMGSLVETLCLRIAVGGTDTLADLAGMVEATAADALASSDIPLERIVSALQAGQKEKSRAHPVRILFGLHSQEEGLPSEPTAITEEAALDLEVHLAHTTHNRMDGKIIYSTDLFQSITIDGIIAVFREILRGGIEQPQEPVSALPLGGLDKLRAMGLLGVERTDYARDSSVVDVFRERAAATPDVLAVVDSTERLTYAQLDARSDATAVWLRRRAIPAEGLVAVLAPRSCEAVAAFLAILKANLAYVPLDPRVPAARVAEILSAMPGAGKRLVLVGRGVCDAEIPGVDVELCRIEEAVDPAGAASAAASTGRPLATSLAYVMFTSGSTGRPKGVMIEHRGIVRLVLDRSVLPADKAAVPVAHIANPAFDMATWEIYTALLSGGTVVCIDHMTVLDPKALAAVFEREMVRAAVFTPAFLKQYLYESPSIFSQLDMLLSGGDAIRPQDALRATQLVRHAFCNAYGPTENTGISTMYRMDVNEQCANGVPIGRAYSNSGAYVMDPLMRPVPLGVLGELVVTGDGLARGYTDAALDHDRFVTIQVDGREPVRAYRTGDRVRWRPTDGQIEFFGRIDQQVKIRGHRIELAEVENALLGHGGLRDAAVIVHKDDIGEPEMIGFVEPRAEDAGADDEDGQVEIWVNHYEQQNYATLGGVDSSTVGNDFVGWTSMYDGSAIDRTEMQEWLDDTIRTILDGRPPGRVLEIGTGSGMILFNLGKAGGLENYVGIEPSKSAAAFVTQRVASIPELAGRVQMNVGTAEDLANIDAQQPELVVINSVTQLFPSPEYLLDVVRAITSIPTVKRVYFGDIRSHAIDRQFLAGRALHSLGNDPKIAKAEFRAMIDKMEDREEELLVGPAFFTGLAGLLPDQVRHVEVIPKRMVATNELSSYRYAAVIHLSGAQEAQEPPRAVDPSKWVDFQESALDRDGLAGLLKAASGASDTVAIANIPYSKTIVERQVLAALEDEADDDEAWVAAARQAAERCPSLSALDLAHMAEEAGFRVEISWARQLSRRAALDAVFHRYPASVEGTRVLFRFPTDDTSAPVVTFANRPLQKLQSRRVEAEVREKVQALLPSYMVPDRIVVLDRMPINANGKVDRKELTRMARTTVKKSKAASLSTRVAPRDEVEAAVCDEFFAVLGVEVGIEDNFFNQGGHSLMATRLASRLSRRLDADVTVKNIFDQPVLKDLAATIRRSSSAYSQIPGASYSAPVEQSFAQGRLWFLGQLNISTSSYVVPLATRLRGQLQVDALEAALHALEQRHETLRTTFQDGDDGMGIQVVQPVGAQKQLRIIDTSGDYSQALRDEQAVSFDLRSEPGWKVTLLRIAPDDYILSIVMHHIISDGWSFDVIRKDLSRLYSAAAHGRDPLTALNPLPIQYRDFSVWQKLPEQAAEHQRQLEYWKIQLADSSPAELLCDRQRPAFLSGEAGIVQFTIEGAAYERLQAFCRAHQTTSFIVLLAAFRAAHYRLTGVDDATVGTPIANRNRPELENLIGFFVNTQCMRITIDEKDTTFDTLVKQVRATATAAFANQDVPFERIVSALLRGSQDASRNPLVQLLFALHSQVNLDKVELEGMSAEPAPGPMATRLDLEFHLFQVQHSLSGKVLYSTDLFERKTVEGVVAVFQEVLRRGLDRPQTPISALPLTDRLDELNRMGLMHIERTSYPRDSSVVDIFRQQAAALPDAIAVTEPSGQQLTYFQLEAKSDETAAWLRRRDIPAETLIGVLAPRSCEAVVAFMGILKAKLAYIPLDVNVPGARIGAILSAAECKLVLLGRGVPPPDADLTGVDVIRINDTLDHDAAGSPPQAEAADGPLATNLAYVMFTSGSTGKPKGVMVEHRGIVRLVKDTNIMTSAASAVPVAHVTTLSFDLSTWELYAPLLNGGSVVCIDYMTLLDPAALAKTFARDQVRAALLTPAFLKQCLANAESAAAIAQLDTLLACGERLDVQDAIAACKVATKCGIINAYGPTENTTFSTIFKMTLQEGCPNGVPIGRSLTNSGSYIMDGRQRLVPIGVMGELVVTGDGLARGYTDPALDRDRFIEVEIAGERVKAYRTGDKARYRPTDGEMEFFGRIDQQVKIRGHRIELAEVEHGLLRHEAVTDAAVVVRNTQEGQEPEMIAFVRAPRLAEQRSHAGVEAEIRNRLRVFLPKYMIPEGIVLMDQMPLNANGKVDRKELSRLAQTAVKSEVQAAVAVAARDEVELAVCDECASVLGVAEVGVNDDFFALGGHSLMATKLAARLSRRLGTSISVKDIFDRPVLADLAATIRRSSASHNPIRRAREYSRPVEQSFAQGRVWFMEQLAGGTTSYLMSMATRLRGALNIQALEAALAALEQRHETLRTVFGEVDGVGVQKVLQSGGVKLKVMGLSPEDDDFTGLLLKQQTTPFDLTSEPAWRVSLIQLPGGDDHVLSIVMHHIIADGWSIDVLRHELGQFYAAALSGHKPLEQIAPLPIQYRDFSAWQREPVQTAEHGRQLEYWKTQLADGTPAEFLTDRSRPSALSGGAGVIDFVIDSALYERLQAFCRAGRTTSFIALLAAFRAAHYRLTGVEDATIGSLIANRNRPEIENLIGFFVNTQCMRITVGDHDSFAGLVEQTRTTAAVAFANQDVPFERIVSALLPGTKDMSRNPLVQTMLVLHSQEDLDRIQLEGLAAEPVTNAATTRLDVEFHMLQRAGSLSGQALYSTDLFEPKTIRGLVSVFLEVLRQGLEQPQEPISTLPLITDGLDELRSMGLLGDAVTEYPRDASVVDLFRQQAATRPDATAVVDSSHRITYRELDQQSDQLEAWLRERQLKPETLVGVLAPRSCEAIVTFMGILKAGLAYVPLDINVPGARIGAILSAIPGKKILLLGKEVAPPDMDLSDVELVRVAEALVGTEISPLAPVDRPLATNLAYVMFTSGSTGRPKGVMVEHRGIVRLVAETNVASLAQVTVPVAHVTTLSFDLSTWEIYAPLLNGGSVVCIDYMTLLNPAGLADLFLKEGVRAALFTPAFLKQCLAESTAIISGLDILLACGDRLDPRDAVRVCEVAKCGIVNAYGPTENTTFSTIFRMHAGENCTNGVPIGRPISNSGAYVMDRKQQLVPPGVIGELVVTGDGLARGYTDPDLDRNRFVEILVDSTSMKAYRTGDRARYRPSDGELEFFGRMDQQIKIRGHRIEPAEVEYAILKQNSVADAAVVVRTDKGQEPEIVAFVATKTTKNTVPDNDDASGQVDGWVTHFDKSTYTDIEKIEDTSLGSDFMGWTSMYDGSLIDRAEMQEWLDETMQAMLEGAAPGRVLEVGTGSGMILFNLARAEGGLERYWGLEPSHAAAKFVEERVKTDAKLAGRVHMHVGTAADVGHLELKPELVVINSVIQYFPTPEYLTDIIGQLVRMPGVNRIFFGDVRSYAIDKQFLASRALHSLAGSATKAGIKQIISELTESEEELLIDPAFFTSLKKQLPDLIHHVEILPKRMTATNELSSYRYAAVIHVSHANARPVHTIDQTAWVDFDASGMGREGLSSLLRGAPAGATIAVANIPWSKTMLERLVVELLDTEGDSQDTVDGAAWISAVRSAAERRESLSAADLERLAKEAGFRVEISWARQRSRAGAIDAVFHKLTTERGARVLYQFLTDDEAAGSLATQLTSQPLERLHRRRVEVQIREGLQKILPAYMVPEKIVMFGGQLPVNSNGKVDRKELGRMAKTVQKPGAMSSVRVAPRDDIEAVICEEFASVLGVEVGINDNFFDQGGHSLMATKLAARLSRRLNTDISVKNIFDQPVLGDLAATIRRISASHNPIAKTAHDGPIKLSFAQGRLWFLDQINLGKTAYIIPMATRLLGPINTEALEAAIRALEARHETLRTTFHEIDGVGMQAVGPVGTVKLHIVDMSDKTHEDYTQFLRREQTTAFYLAVQPGWRTALIKLGHEDHVLSVVMHHIISDGWSIEVMRRELGQFYAAALRGRDPLSAVPALPIQYRDFAVWQTQQSAEHGRQLQYWKKMLADSSPAELLTDKPRPATLSGDAGVVTLAIDGSVYEDLQAFCRYHQTTSFTVLLAAFRAVHYRLTTGAENATIGTPIANRNRPELENMIGFFVNTQCMKIAVDKDDTFEGLVRQVRSTTTGAFANQDVPFERIVSELLPGLRDSSASRNPLVQLMFALHSQQDLERIPLEGLAAEAVPGNPTTRMDLEFHLLQGEKGLAGRVLYSKDLFEESTVNCIVAVFLEILRRGLDRPRTPLSTLPLTDGLDEVRSMGLLDIRQTNYPRGSVVEAFRNQAAAHPDVTAVVDLAARMTYRELDEKSDQLETWLRRRKGVSPETLVGVLAPRSCEAVVAFLGVLKANLAYIPLDTNAPSARIATILSSVSEKTLMLIGHDVPLPDCATADVEPVRIADTLENAGPAEVAPAGQQPSATSLAYVMFTSGSTGHPKGVMVEHRGIVRLASEPDVALAGAPIAHMANTAFDAATWEIYTALLSGGTVVCIDYMTVLDPVALSAVFAAEGVRGALFTPALLKQCMASAPAALACLDLLVVGADRFPPQSAIEAARLVPGAVFNVYGPTENSCISTKYRVSVGEENYTNGVPIGRAIANSGAFVMDGQQKIVPLGVMGELVVTGDGLARGYTDHCLNEGRFVSVTINGETTRAYRTGDRVRYRADGQIEFFGRMDQQVKIRGHRIEVAEIEHALVSHEAVQDATVVIRAQDGQEADLVAFVTSKQGPEVERNIRTRLQALLPAYMVPERIVILDQMPVNANGKVDSKELERMAQTVPRWVEDAADDVFVPKGEVEEIIRTVVAGVVNISLKRVPANRSFVGMGGDSITAMQAMSLCRQRGVSLQVRDILGSASILAMAAKATRLGDAEAAAGNEQESEHKFASFPLSPIQKLHLAQFPEGENHYSQSLLLKVRKPTADSTIQAALLDLIRRHPMLRARFEKGPSSGQWTQAVRPMATDAISFSIASAPSWDKARDVMAEAYRCLDITAGPVVATRIIRVGEETSLLMVAHHLVIDLVSWRTLLQDLEQLIDGAVPLSEAQTSWSYQRWVRSLHKYSDTEAAAAALALPSAAPEPNLEFWGMDASSANDSTNLVEGEFTLDSAVTETLVRAAEKSVKAELPDVLLAVAAHAFAATFPERTPPPFHTETHGRDHPRDTSVTVHNTVGWFTAIVPLVVASADGDDWVDRVVRAKDARRDVPGLGVPYFTSKMLRSSERPYSLPFEVVLNYLGRFQQLERAEGLFEFMPRTMRPADVNPSAARISVIDISAVVEKDALTVAWSYGAAIRHQERLAKWFGLLQQGLEEVAVALQRAPAQLTRADVPLLPISHTQLERLNWALTAVSPIGADGVEDVYPTSPMQRGILLSQAKDASQYDVHFVWEISPADSGGQIDVARLERAWHRVVERHPMLRTVFINDGLRDDSPFDQVVLKKTNPSTTTLACGHGETALEKVWAAPRGAFVSSAPAHRLTICAGTQGEVYAHLQVSHALIDATSLQILLRDWNRAYAGSLPASAGPSYSSYIAHIQKTSLDASLRFWTSNLEGATVCRLPQLTDGKVPGAGRREIRNVRTEVVFASRLAALARSLHVSVANIFQLAWALVLRSYSSQQDVCFGYIASGRDVDLDGISDAVGPFINMLVSHVVFDDSDGTPTAMLRRLFDSYVDSLPHQHAPLADITHALNLPSGGLFNTALSFQRVSTPGGGGDLPLSFRPVKGADPTEFDVMINVLSSDDRTEFAFDYRSDYLTDAQAKNIAQSMVQALKAIVATPEAPVGSLQLLPEEHLSQLKKWGEDLPSLVDRTVHDMFADVCRQRPDAAAVHAWDGDFTYAQLDEASSKLAGILAERGVKTGDFVTLCFEKSAWVPVALLAVLKAGAAFLILEADAPRERIKYMLSKIGSSLTLCSAACSAVVADWGTSSIVVGPETIAITKPVGQLPSVPSSSACYVVFTSGTTGQPKGAVTEHGAFCTSSVAQAKNMSLGPSTRCLQFSSFMFDISLLEMIMPLLAGGCVVIPRKQDMLDDFARVVRDMNVNWTILTPSFLRTLNPQADMAPLQIVFLVGEVVSQKDVEDWADIVHLGNSYGPAECSAIASVWPRLTRSIEGPNIGHGSGCCRWVTVPGDRNRLAPVGAIGELLLEGASLARGYINDPAKTAEVFLSGLPWAPLVGRTPETRFYATGDLVRANSDGSLTFIGRTDTQVKINGQRIELGEVHHHLVAMDEIRHSVVMNPSKGPLSGRLVAAIELKNKPSTAAGTERPGMSLIAPHLRARAAQSVGRIRDVLSQRLPTYMVPAAWIVLQDIPTNISRKLDVGAVKSWVAAIDAETYREIHALMADGTSELASTETVAVQISQRLDVILGGTSGVPRDLAGKDFVPMQYGLDSIAAITLSTWMRNKFGAAVSMATLLSPQTSVRTLAALVKENGTKNDTKNNSSAEGSEASTSTAVTSPTRDSGSVCIDLRAEIDRFDKKLAQLPLAAPAADTRNLAQGPSTFLVTGATGFLGSQIVKQLLLRLEAKRVFCIVRASDDEKALERMVTVARNGGWWREDYAGRLTAWRGDLSQPRLGLDASRWGRITSGEIEAIIHNGAVVHWHVGYDDIVAANVESTFDLLSALSAAPFPPRFAYVSGGYFGAADETDDQIADLLGESGGYAQTKFVSEMLVRRHGERLAAASPDFPTPVVLKPGLVIGDKDSGLSNLDDFLWRVVGSAVRVGGYNADEADDAGAWLLAAGSDQIASATVDACASSDGSKSTIRFVDGVPVKEIWRILTEDPELGFELKPMASRDWMVAVERDMNARGPSHPIFPVFNFLQGKQGTIGIRRMRGEEPMFSEAESLERVRRSLVYLKSIGFFSADGASQPTSGFQRSGWRLADAARV